MTLELDRRCEDVVFEELDAGLASRPLPARHQRGARRGRGIGGGSGGPTTTRRDRPDRRLDERAAEVTPGARSRSPSPTTSRWPTSPSARSPIRSRRRVRRPGRGAARHRRGRPGQPRSPIAGLEVVAELAEPTRWVIDGGIKPGTFSLGHRLDRDHDELGHRADQRDLLHHRAVSMNAAAWQLISGRPTMSSASAALSPNRPRSISTRATRSPAVRREEHLETILSGTSRPGP